MGRVSELGHRLPGHRGRIPPSAGDHRRDPRADGYSTFAVGKWHLAPIGETPPGLTTTGPCQRGFDRFYGFLDGETNQWHPDLVHDNHQIEPPRDRDGYHLTEDIVDQASHGPRQRSVAPGQAVLPVPGLRGLPLARTTRRPR